MEKLRLIDALAADMPFKIRKLISLLFAFLLLLGRSAAYALDANQTVTQIKSQIVNKAIGETEAFINAQANQLAQSTSVLLLVASANSGWMLKNQNFT